MAKNVYLDDVTGARLKVIRDVIASISNRGIMCDVINHDVIN